MSTLGLVDCGRAFNPPGACTRPALGCGPGTGSEKESRDACYALRKVSNAAEASETASVLRFPRSFTSAICRLSMD